MFKTLIAGIGIFACVVATGSSRIASAQEPEADYSALAGLGYIDLDALARLAPDSTQAAAEPPASVIEPAAPAASADGGNAASPAGVAGLPSTGRAETADDGATSSMLLALLLFGGGAVLVVSGRTRRDTSGA